MSDQSYILWKLTSRPVLIPSSRRNYSRYYEKFSQRCAQPFNLTLAYEWPWEGCIHHPTLWASALYGWKNPAQLCQESYPRRYAFINLRKRHNNDTSLSLDDHPHFLEYAAELANALRSTIFVDQVRTLSYLAAWVLILHCAGCISVFSQKWDTTTSRRAHHREHR